MYPKEEKEEKEEKEDDIEASIAKEVAEIKDSSSDKKRFTNITTGTDCCKEYIYIYIHGKVDLFAKILQ